MSQKCECRRHVKYSPTYRTVDVPHRRMGYRVPPRSYVFLRYPFWVGMRKLLVDSLPVLSVNKLLSTSLLCVGMPKPPHVLS
jgi:hypothetical protein